MTNRQIEELAKLCLDLGKLVIAALVLGFFQTKLEPKLVLSYGLLGLTISLGLFKMGLELLKGIK